MKRHIKNVNWTTVGTVGSLIGVALAALFCASKLKSAADEASQTRQAAEVQLFTQLNDSVGSSTRALLLHRGEISRAVTDDSAVLSDAARADAVKAFNDRNYLAALINAHIIKNPAL